MKPRVYVTFDVECGMGGAWGDADLRPVPPDRAVWGRFGGAELGLPLITEILNRNNLAATFFVEAFMDEQGSPDQSEPICTYLLDRGQDVQLHIHPNHKHYGLHRQEKPHPLTDQITDLEPQAQRALLAEGRDRIARWTGRPPAAFRAGNMGASEQTLEQVAAVGMKIDSSYTFPYAGGQCGFGGDEPYNGSKWYGRVLELALSGFYQPRMPGLRPAKPLDLMGISFEECRDAIRSICGAGADAVLILHSFSLFKVRNAQYDGGRLNRIVTRRFRRLCRWLSENRDDFPACTFNELAGAIDAGLYEAKAVTPCRLKSRTRALARKAAQAFNNIYWT